jgi:hypothetical protein
MEKKQSKLPGSSFREGIYWQKRSDLLYYRYIDFIIRTIGRDANSLIDVGSGNCPYLEWFDWIPNRVSVDIRVPYSSNSVNGIVGNIHDLSFTEDFDVCTCLQVLEHVPDAKKFSQRLLSLAKTVVVSVPYMWPILPKPAPGHVHDPVSYKKLSEWMGREANYKIIVTEPLSKGRSGRRLIAIYDRDRARVFDSKDKENRRLRESFLS